MLDLGVCVKNSGKYVKSGLTVDACLFLLWFATKSHSFAFAKAYASLRGGPKTMVGALVPPEGDIWAESSETRA